jgi:hypothetical protein
MLIEPATLAAYIDVLIASWMSASDDEARRALGWPMTQPTKR